MNVCIDPILKDLLKTRGITAEVFDIVLSKSEKEHMLEDLEIFSSKWFMDNGRDISKYRDVSIGAAIHDDVLHLFNFLFHLLYVLKKLDYKNNTIVFYHSTSCRLPSHVEKIISDIGVEVKLTNDLYPFYCYDKAHRDIAYTVKTYSGLVYDRYSQTKYRSTIRPTLRSMYYRLMFKVVYHFYSNNKNTIYLRIMRRLEPMVENFINNEGISSSIQIVLEFHKHKIQTLIQCNNYLNPIIFFKQLRKLAKVGIFFSYPLFLIGPKNYILKKYFHQKERTNQNKLIRDSKHIMEKLINIDDLKLSDAFINEFTGFYFHHFTKFVILIDRLDNKVKKNRIDQYLVEFINPFFAQILVNYNRKIFLVHLSRWLSSQYFCEQLINNIRNRLYTLVSSKYEYNRVLKQGFNHKTIIKVYENYFDNREINNNKILNHSLKKKKFVGKNILVIPPPLGALIAFRTKLDSTFLINFITDMVKILAELKVSTIVIRPGLDNRKINSNNFVASDIDEYVLKNMKKGKFNLVYRNKMNMVDIEDDLREAHIVIGTLSACSIDAALNGMDYIVYDNSLYPFPDTLNYSIFSKGSPVQMASRKDDLINMLYSFEPSQGRKVIDYIRPFNESDINVKPLKDIYSSDLFNTSSLN
jgi:hypothetical protein